MFSTMRKTTIAAAVAGTLATALAVPAEAGILQGPTTLAGPSDGLVQDVGWRQRGPHHRHWHRHGGNDWVAPLIGGMVIGGMLAAPYYGYAPPPRHRYYNRDAYCHARYRSYNSYTGLYFGYDGRYHRCR